MWNPQTLLVAALLIGGVAAVTLTNDTSDPLADVQSGVAASLVVHAAIIDSDAGPDSYTSVKFSPRKGNTAFLAPAAVGSTLRPLQQVVNEGGGSGSSCVATTNILSGQTGGQSILKAPTDTLMGRVFTSNGGHYLKGVNVQLYKSSGNGPQYYGIRTTDVEGRYVFANVPTEHGGYVYSYASPTYVQWDGRNSCMDQSNFLQAASAPPPTTGGSSGSSTSSALQPQVCPPKCGSTTGGAGSGPSGTVGKRDGTQDASGANPCLMPSDPAFRAWIANAGYSCVYFSEIDRLQREWQQETAGSAGGGTTDASVINGPVPANALIPITITGDVTTKNLAKNVTVTAQVVVKTAAGKTITRDLPIVTVGSAGGAINGLTTTLDLLKADIGTGRTELAITVKASSQDFAGQALQDGGTLMMFADTDYRGEVKLRMSAASFVSTFVLDGGAVVDRERTLTPKILG